MCREILYHSTTPTIQSYTYISVYQSNNFTPLSLGVDTSCSGHGTYQHDTCSCLCNPGWEGPDCSVSSCPDECNDNGRCVDGKCVCHQGYTGHDCSQLTCPDDCNDKGHCVDGKCVCFPHFTGEDCSVQKCPNDCIVNGQCVDGQCICDEGFYGEDCSLGKLFKNSLLIQSFCIFWQYGLSLGTNTTHHMKFEVMMIVICATSSQVLSILLLHFTQSSVFSSIFKRFLCMEPHCGLEPQVRTLSAQSLQ